MYVKKRENINKKTVETVDKKDNNFIKINNSNKKIILSLK